MSGGVEGSRIVESMQAICSPEPDIGSKKSAGAVASAGRGLLTNAPACSALGDGTAPTVVRGVTDNAVVENT